MSQQFQHSLTLDEIGSVRRQIIGVLDFLNTNKTRIMPQDFRQLNNHLQYSLTTLTNMSNVLSVEKSDPYNSHHADYSKVTGTGGRTVVYNQDGTTRVVNAGAQSFNTTGDGWEQQFDQGLLQKPPCFVMPPQSLTHIPSIRKSSQYDMTKGL